MTLCFGPPWRFFDCADSFNEPALIWPTPGHSEGTGKSHLLIGLASPPASQGRRVRYVTGPQRVNELVEASDERRLSRIVARYGRLDLLCLDELGYVQPDARGAELLFQVITEREERAANGCGSNLPFSKAQLDHPRPRLVAAIVDRLTFHAHIFETGTERFRLRTTRATKVERGPPHHRVGLGQSLSVASSGIM